MNNPGDIMGEKTRRKIGFCQSLSAAMLFWLVALNVTYAAPTGPEGQCLHCHEDIWAEGQSKKFIHQPFQAQQCGDCHVDPPSASEMLEQSRQREQKRGQVKWVDRRFVPARTHWFRVPANSSTKDLFIEARASRGKIVQRRLSLLPCDDLPRYDNDHISPQISQVKVLEVNREVLVSATISWETNEAANSVVRYGLDRLNLSSVQEDNFTTRHQIMLVDINPRETYRFRVSSEDLFGNRATSEIFTLVAGNDFSRADEQPLLKRADIWDIEIDTEIFQSDGGYLLKLTANQPVKLNIGLTPALRKKEPAGKQGTGNGTQEVKHVLTINEFYLNVSTCYGCHGQYVDGMSHPVNVYPKRGMTIPPEYPTLEDGRITCMSCHAIHASNLEHRVIKPSAKELCVGCHKEFRINSKPDRPSWYTS